MVKIIEPSVEIISDINGSKILKRIERAARTCYKSEGLITEDDTSARKMISKLIEMGHTAMLEFADIHCLYVADTGFLKDITRMRLCSFAAECLSGDTKVLNNLTIKELYDKHNQKYCRIKNLRSVNENNDIIPNKIIDVWYKGQQDVYEVTTSLGYKIKTTMNHCFKSKNGEYKPLKEILVGDEVYVNGRPSLVPVDDNKLIELYETYNIGEISELFSISRASVRKKLKKIGVYIPRKNDSHNKEKYNRNHTKETYEKMRLSCIKTYKNGRTPWNKGVRYYESESVEKQRQSLIKHHHNGERYIYRYKEQGDCHSSRVYKDIGKASEYFCELCGNPAKEWHHKDKNRRNNYRDNLLALCINCHKKLHKGWEIGKRAHLDKIISIKYKGVEDVYDIEMNNPYNNFVANGFIVHNSTRWCSYNKDKFGRELSVIRPVHIKKGTPEYEIWLKANEDMERYYMAMADLGCKPDQLRMLLNHSVKTEINLKTNIREWRHVLNLRCDKPVHPSIRHLMLRTLDIFHNKIPVLFDDIYDKYKNDIEEYKNL